MVGRKNDGSRTGAASLATTIAEPQTGLHFLTGICKGLCNRNCLNCEEGSSLPSWKSMVTRCSGYGRKWIIGLTSALIQRADTYSTYEVCKKKKKTLGDFLRPSEGGMLQSFPPFKCAYFLKCIREL